MLESLGRFTVKYATWILIVALPATALAAVLGFGVFGRLSSGGFDDPNSESSRASVILEKEFSNGTPNFVLLATPKSGSLDDPLVAAKGYDITAKLAAEPGVEAAFSYWSLGMAAPLKDTKGTKAMILAKVTGTSDTQVAERSHELLVKYGRSNELMTVVGGGSSEVVRAVTTQIQKDLHRAELITLPIVIILLIVVFGSVIAAGLPIVMGALAVVGSLAVLTALTLATHVSIFSINLTTALGLGLGIDYSLFIVSRFREELRRGLEPSDAVARTLATAGRTVVFSGLTVATSMAALMVFPMYFLRSFAYAGIAVVITAVAGSIVVLPALLSKLSYRVNRLSVRPETGASRGPGLWYHLATVVMRFAPLVTIAVVVFLLVLGSPFLGAKFGIPDDRILPPNAPVRQIQDQIRTGFGLSETTGLSVVAPSAGLFSDQMLTDVESYATRLSKIKGVGRVDSLSGSFEHGKMVIAPGISSYVYLGMRGTWLSVVPSVEPLSAQGERVVEAIRAMPAPFHVMVAGPSAYLVDAKAAVLSRIPLAAILIGLVTFVALFFLTGSVVIPIKAIVLNLLSLTATFGAMVWIFQDGHLSGLLGFSPTGTLDTSTPILMFCVAFGLSMDYEVFLLSRIKEDYDLTGDNLGAVARGLDKTGGIVTAAAALLAAVFLGFATSEISILKLLGLGLALAVVMDATLIRGVLVPAFMGMMGKANWWAPAMLRSFHDQYGISESGSRPRPAGVSPRPAGISASPAPAVRSALVLQPAAPIPSSVNAVAILSDMPDLSRPWARHNADGSRRRA
jgi:putative drug exporter of the RND superfamily